MGLEAGIAAADIVVLRAPGGYYAEALTTDTG